jgi:putative intracellular protease/amidase
MSTNSSTPSKKVLIIVSDAHSFPLKKSDGSTVNQATGYFLMELAKPLKKLLDAGYEVTFASPLGKEPQPDPLSTTLLAFAGNYYEQQREIALVEGKMKSENNLKHPKPFADISDDELRNYTGIFIPGGHAPLADLGDNKELGRILSHFHDNQKPTATICHGPYAFLSTKNYGGEFAYKGYKITSWSDMEEKVMETLFWGDIEKVESALKKEGAQMVTGLGTMAGSITVDREVVSGGNPLAADALGEKFLEMLKAKA